MNDSTRTGVRLVLTNSADPDRLDDFTSWYDDYGAGLTRPGFLSNAVRFENVDAMGGDADPRFATFYDIAVSDPATAWPSTEASPDYPTAMFADQRSRLVSPALRGSFALVGRQESTAVTDTTTGIHLILSNGSDDTWRQQREAALLATGHFRTASRFRLIEGSPTPPAWLEVFETSELNPFASFDTAVSAIEDLGASDLTTVLSRSFSLAHSFARP